MIGAYLTDTVEIIRETRDAWGTIVATAIESIPARIDNTRRRVVNAHGEEVASEKSVLMEDRELSEDDKLHIDGVDWKIIRIAKRKEWTWQFLEVFL